MRHSSELRTLTLLSALALHACRETHQHPPASLAEPERAVRAEGDVTMSSAFDNVTYGFLDSPCSPQFTAGEPDGIKIAMPGEFELPEGSGHERAKLPLCVTLRFDSLYLSKFEYVFKAIKVVLVDENGAVLSGGIWRDRHYAPPRRNPGIPPEELKKRIATKYNTVDLLEHIELPPRKATYKVYALLEQHKSNVATIEIAVPAAP